MIVICMDFCLFCFCLVCFCFILQDDVLLVYYLQFWCGVQFSLVLVLVFFFGFFKVCWCRLFCFLFLFFVCVEYDYFKMWWVLKFVGGGNEVEGIMFFLFEGFGNCCGVGGSVLCGFILILGMFGSVLVVYILVDFDMLSGV